MVIEKQLTRIFPLIVTLLLVSSCALFGDEKDPASEWNEERLYFEAKSALDSEYYSKAIEHYESLQSRFPFGDFSKQAQLDLAYAYHKAEEPASAIAACNRFIKLYPTNPHVDYAYYLKGLASFNQGKGLTQRYLPTDPSQRDPGASMQAFRDFTELTKRFPNSEYASDAQKRMVYLRNILAQHEVNVANYYMRRGAYVAVVNRAGYVVENYQQTPAMPEALILMARAYKVLQMDELANDALRVLKINFPNHPGIRDVEDIVIR